jgi:hypothetical protein
MRNKGRRASKSRHTMSLHLSLERLENRCLLAPAPLGAVAPDPSDSSAVPAQAAPAASPAATVSITVSGTAKWTDPGNGTHAIPLADVEIRSTTEKDTDPALAKTKTDENGNFTTPSAFADFRSIRLPNSPSFSAFCTFRH